MTETRDVTSELIAIREQMKTDFAKLVQVYAKQANDPPGALTDLAAQIAMGKVSGRPGEASAMLERWDSAARQYEASRAAAMASFSALVNVLDFLSDKGFLHQHTDGEND